MSLNLVQQVRDLFSGDVVDQASNQLGESPSSISTAIDGIVPAIFSGLINKIDQTAGADVVANLATNASNEGDGIMNNIGNLLSGSGSGSSIISSIFGGSGNGIAGAIANFAGIKPGSASSLMQLAGTAVLGFLGKHMSTNNVDANGLSNLLSSQQQNVAAAMPAGLNLSSMLGETPTVKPTTAAHMGADRVTASSVTTNPNYAADVDSDDTGNGLKWLIPVLLLALLGAGALYYFKSGYNNAAGGAHQNESGMHSDSSHTNMMHTDSTHTDTTQSSMNLLDTTIKVADTTKTVNY